MGKKCKRGEKTLERDRYIMYELVIPPWWQYDYDEYSTETKDEYLLEQNRK